jgi:hypothetical protein
MLIAAWLFVALTAFTVAFQVALLCGAPWGHLTLGGKYTGALPPRARVAPAVSIVLLSAFALIVLSRAGIVLAHEWARVAVWLPVAYLVLGAVLNTITPSKAERRLWLPVILALLACALVVALRAQ